MIYHNFLWYRKQVGLASGPDFYLLLQFQALQWSITPFPPLKITGNTPLEGKSMPKTVGRMEGEFPVYSNWPPNDVRKCRKQTR